MKSSFSWSLSLLTTGMRLSAFIIIIRLWINSLEVVWTSSTVHVLNCSGTGEVTSKTISFLKLIFIGVQSLYTAGLVSAVQQKESAIRAHLAPLFKSASPLGHHRALRRALCAPRPWGPPPPGSSVHGVLQARVLQCVAMPSYRRSSQPRDWTHVSFVSCIGREVLYHWHHLGSPGFY